MQVTVEKDAVEKAVKTKKILKICPFSHFTEEEICRGERCQLWDVERGCCQIEDLGEILKSLLGVEIYRCLLKS